jgi:hypothetical protein
MIPSDSTGDAGVLSQFRARGDPAPHPFDLGVFSEASVPGNSDELVSKDILLGGGIDLDLYAEETIEYKMQIGDCIYTLFCGLCECSLSTFSSLSCGEGSC